MILSASRKLRNRLATSRSCRNSFWKRSEGGTRGPVRDAHPCSSQRPDVHPRPLRGSWQLRQAAWARPAAGRTLVTVRAGAHAAPSPRSPDRRPHRAPGACACCPPASSLPARTHFAPRTLSCLTPREHVPRDGVCDGREDPVQLAQRRPPVVEPAGDPRRHVFPLATAEQPWLRTQQGLTVREGHPGGHVGRGSRPTCSVGAPPAARKLVAALQSQRTLLPQGSPRKWPEARV